MTAAEVWRGLARRAEAAQGPDRALDGEVWCALNDYTPVRWDGAGMAYRDPGAPDWRRRDIQHCPGGLIKPYTASVDAGITTISAVIISLSDIGGDGLPFARIGETEPPAPLDGIGTGRTLPLALIAASMNLRAEQADRDQGTRA
ncbi:MAG: hypothetical protein E7K72_26805 [Roseomonas mucosa]|nr:hypothetical protein [Roseomonas mucosa]